MLKTLLWALIRAPLWAPILVPCLGHRQGLPNNVLEPPPHTPGKKKKITPKTKKILLRRVHRNLCDEGRYTTRRYFFDFAEFVQIFVFAELSRSCPPKIFFAFGKIAGCPILTFIHFNERNGRAPAGRPKCFTHLLLQLSTFWKAVVGFRLCRVCH